MSQSRVEFKSETMLQKLLIGGTLLAALNSFERGDYNIAIYPLIYLIFENPHQIKNFHTQTVRLAYLLLFTIFIDIFWFIYWAGEFSTILDNQQMQWMEFPIHLTVFLSVVGIFIKFGVAYFMKEEHQHIHDSVGVEHVQDMALEFFTNHQTPQEPQLQQQYQQQQYDQQHNINDDYKVSNKKSYNTTYYNN